MIDDRVGMAMLAVAIGLLALSTMAFLYLRHLRAERARWSRYSPRGRSEPVSVVCPHCRLRIYSPRAIAEGVCPRCEGRITV